MRQATFKSLWVAVKDLLYTVLNSLYTGLFNKQIELDIKIEDEDVTIPRQEDEYLGI